MSRRTDLVLRLADFVGPSLVVEHLADGWPSLASVDLDGERLDLALFAAQTGLSHRDRDDVERRFQNPDQNRPIVPQPGRYSVLLGLWEADPYIDVIEPVVTIADAQRRADGRVTRWSVFVEVGSLQEAHQTGWSTRLSDSGEELHSFRPELFPALAAFVAARVSPDENTVRASVQATGYFDLDLDPRDRAPRERLRRAVSVLARDAKFHGRVLDKFDRRCAMCGLGFGLVQGAHIYPASAPDSTDAVANGVALCANHHLAFDRHLFAIEPETWQIVYNPELLGVAVTDSAARQLIAGAVRAIDFPALYGQRVDAYLRMRYEYYADKYHWL